MTDSIPALNPQQQALQWLTRMTSGAVDSQQQAQFEAWLQADVRHQHAYAEAEQLWLQLGELAHSPAFQSILAEYRQKPRQQARVRKRQTMPYYGLALAACITCVAIALPWLKLWWQADVITGSGESRILTLTDGSQVYLNTETALVVAYRKDERHIRLLRGEAEFVVRKDLARPFVVSVGDERIKALGTDFIVRCHQQKLTVTMLENRVEISMPEQTPLILNPGEQLRHSHGEAILEKTRVDIQKVSAWRRGKLIFEATPLTEVIEEINRYRSGRVMLLSNQYDKLSVSGVFDLRNLNQLLDVMEQTLPVKTAHVSDQLIIIY